ncbi:hypothetical protein V5O48_002963 [Marasmius crinis-equi]|uniref:Uncharacterized protein n=1 Tax=Marasmius crinis-equi TaxID=585013 RepID=A0ABR3FU63_9AGAR
MPKATPLTPPRTQSQMSPYSTPPPSPEKSSRKVSTVSTGSLATSPSQVSSRLSRSDTSQANCVGSLKYPATPPSTIPTLALPTWTFNFGTHRGNKISDVPWDYVQYLLRNGILDDPRRGDFIRALLDFLRAKNRDLEARLLALRLELPDWLYDHLFENYVSHGNDQLAIVGVLDHSQLNMLKSRLHTAEGLVQSGLHEEYPARPPSSWTFHECSVSMESLREALSRCPKVRRRRAITEEERDYVEELEENSSVTKRPVWTFTGDYALELKQCLHAVLSEHGKIGMRAAWWEVRDKYAKFVSGIRKTVDGGFMDDSLDWLDLVETGEEDVEI